MFRPFSLLKATGILTLFLTAIVPAKAQISFPSLNRDSLNTTAPSFRLTSIQTIATTNEQAFWLTRNDLGLLDDDNLNSLLLLDGFWRNTRSNNINELRIESGVSLAFNQLRTNQVVLPIGYVSVAYKGLKIEGGRFNMQWNQPFDTRISSGDLLYGISSTPIPMIRLGTEVPFAPIPVLSAFKISGFLLHGWFESSRVASNAFLHAKNFRAQLDLGDFTPFFGLTHNAQWGGNSSVNGPLPSGFSDFLDVFTGSSSNNVNAPEGERINVAGNHIGTWNMGFDVRSESMTTSVRFNHLFEDGSGQWMKNGSDGQIQIIVTKNKTFGDKFRSFVDQIVYEYINTTVASGWGTSDAPDSETKFDEFGFRFGGRDNYYNNGIYANGWTYLNQPIHNPLFMTVGEAQRWAPNSEQIVSTLGFASGSILAHHIGFRGAFSLFGEDFRYRHKTSVVRYYGNSGTLPRFFAPYRANENVRSEDYAFFPEVEQYYARLDIEKSWLDRNIPLKTVLSLAIDRGEWHRTFGVGLQIEWLF
jgi:hypothetical protein